MVLLLLTGFPLLEDVIVFLCCFVEMAEDTSSLGSSIATSADDLCEPEAEEEVPTLQKTLEMLSLSEYMSTFEKERIDMESLVQKCSLGL